MIFDTYMGIKEPYDTTWSDGRSVTVYPSGKVVERTTGYLVRNGDFEDNVIDTQKVRVINSPTILNEKNNSILYVIILGIISIVAIVAVSNGKR